MSTPRRDQRPRREARPLAVVPHAAPLAEQVEAWAAELLRPVPPARRMSWEAALSLGRHALRPLRAPVALDLARGEGRTHLAPRWAAHGLCGAALDASGLRATSVTCAACASLLPPEAD
jgi:hypothetical protein